MKRTADFYIQRDISQQVELNEAKRQEKMKILVINVILWLKIEQESTDSQIQENVSHLEKLKESIVPYPEQFQIVRII